VVTIEILLMFGDSRCCYLYYAFIAYYKHKYIMYVTVETSNI